MSHGGRPADEMRPYHQRTDPLTEEQAAILVACRDHGGLVLRYWDADTRKAWTTAECAKATLKNRRPEIRFNERAVRGMVLRDWLRQDGEQIEITAIGEQAIARAKQTEAA
jgi:hypothetical protein